MAYTADEAMVLNMLQSLLRIFAVFSVALTIRICAGRGSFYAASSASLFVLAFCAASIAVMMMRPLSV